MRKCLAKQTDLKTNKLNLDPAVSSLMSELWSRRLQRSAQKRKGFHAANPTYQPVPFASQICALGAFFFFLHKYKYLFKWSWSAIPVRTSLAWVSTILNYSLLESISVCSGNLLTSALLPVYLLCP